MRKQDQLEGRVTMFVRGSSTGWRVTQRSENRTKKSSVPRMYRDGVCVARRFRCLPLEVPLRWDELLRKGQDRISGPVPTENVSRGITLVGHCTITPSHHTTNAATLCILQNCRQGHLK